MNQEKKVFDNFLSNVTIGDHGFAMSLWDTAGPEEYSRLRVLSYIEADVFFVCFSVSSRSSFENISSKWHPELMHHLKSFPGAKFLLVGTKYDLRGTKEAAGREVSFEEAKEKAEKLKMEGSRFLFVLV